MAATLSFAAVDLGAESGRVTLGRFDGSALSLEEIHRFPNVPVRVHGSLQWDILRLWGDIQHGLASCTSKAGGPLASLGVAGWGVDFGLVGRDGHLLGNPVHYRDGRTDGMMEEAFRRVPRGEIYQQTGIQFMPINTLYQLLALRASRSPALDAAAALLTIPDLLNFWLSGCSANELSNATTTQCFNPKTGDWAWDLLSRLGIPARIFGSIIPPGTVLGPVRPAVAGELGLTGVPVIAPATHDTGSAVAAVPMAGGEAIYLSSGTWSLMGVEVSSPVIDERGLAYNFTNEGGVGGTFRLLKNIMGLWLVQECRRLWASQGDEYSYARLTRLAELSPAFVSLVVPSDERFLAPGDMPGRLQAFCRGTGQPVPESVGALVRCALESLALEYRWVAERLEELTGRSLPVIHVIGGGAQNALLNQLTADATGRTVIAGPVEATALGNVLVQAIAGGHLASLEEGRALIRRSCPVQTFEPRAAEPWEAAYQRYLGLRARFQ
ncbi:MAG TPA: rhamnulokinase family protein [Thermoanaerobaculia bacterium]|nr:rhamnulokinase family protein [Thermoanaerobaculia bacterium]